MKHTPLTPTAYHKLGFNVACLPDVAKAGHVSASLLGKVRDPISFLLGKKQQSTAAMAYGSLLDCLWTTPELFPSQYIVLPPDAPDKPTKAMLEAKKPSPASIERQAWWKGFEAKCAGKEIISADLMDSAEQALKMLKQHKTASALLDNSEKQVALVGENPLLPGTNAKCLMDLVGRSGAASYAVIDLKTTNDTSEYALRQTMFRYEYFMKMAWYEELTNASGFATAERSILIWQRSSWPYDVHVREIPRESIKVGLTLAKKRLAHLREMEAMHIEKYFDETISMLGLDEWMIDSTL